MSSEEPPRLENSSPPEVEAADVEAPEVEARDELLWYTESQVEAMIQEEKLRANEINTTMMENLQESYSHSQELENKLAHEIATNDELRREIHKLEEFKDVDRYIATTTDDSETQMRAMERLKTELDQAKIQCKVKDADLKAYEKELEEQRAHNDEYMAQNAKLQRQIDESEQDIFSRDNLIMDLEKQVNARSETIQINQDQVDVLDSNDERWQDAMERLSQDVQDQNRLLSLKFKRMRVSLERFSLVYEMACRRVPFRITDVPHDNDDPNKDTKALPEPQPQPQITSSLPPLPAIYSPGHSPIETVSKPLNQLSRAERTRELRKREKHRQEVSAAFAKDPHFQEWMLNGGFQAWANNPEFQAWVNNGGFQDWANSPQFLQFVKEGGFKWAQSMTDNTDFQAWFSSGGFRQWVENTDFQAWVKEGGFQAWANNPNFQAWVNSGGFQAWANNADFADWANDPNFQAFLNGGGFPAYANNPGFQAWLNDPRAQPWLKNEQFQTWANGGPIYKEVPAGNHPRYYPRTMDTRPQKVLPGPWEARDPQQDGCEDEEEDKEWPWDEPPSPTRRDFRLNEDLSNLLVCFSSWSIKDIPFTESVEAKVRFLMDHEAPHGILRMSRSKTNDGKRDRALRDYLKDRHNLLNPVKSNGAKRALHGAPGSLKKPWYKEDSGIMDYPRLDQIFQPRAPAAYIKPDVIPAAVIQASLTGPYSGHYPQNPYALPQWPRLDPSAAPHAAKTLFSFPEPTFLEKAQQILPWWLSYQGQSAPVAQPPPPPPPPPVQPQAIPTGKRANDDRCEEGPNKRQKSNLFDLGRDIRHQANYNSPVYLPQSSNLREVKAKRLAPSRIWTFNPYDEALVGEREARFKQEPLALSPRAEGPSLRIREKTPPVPKTNWRHNRDVVQNWLSLALVLFMLYNIMPGTTTTGDWEMSNEVPLGVLDQIQLNRQEIESTYSKLIHFEAAKLMGANLGSLG